MKMPLARHLYTCLLGSATLVALVICTDKPQACESAPRVITVDDGGWYTDADDVAAWPGPCTLDVIDATHLSQADFLKRYATTEPVVIRKPTDNSRFREICRKEEFLRSYGSHVIRLSSANTHSYQKLDVTVRKYVEEIMKPQQLDTLGNETFYWFGDNNYTEFEALFGEYKPPPYKLPGHTGAYSFGMAGAGTGVPFHFHGPGFGEVAFGRKRWFLYPPNEEPSFHPNKTTLQWLHEDYPRLYDYQKPLECTLGPEEVIYFPDHWWHGTLNIDAREKSDVGPVSQPLHTFEKVLSWSPADDPYCVASVPLTRRKGQRPNRPRTLICHDMAGGYLHDRFVQGSSSGDAYRFYNWHHIDTFIYFSHHFVTMPPPGWTNAAHKHDVLMLGTVITEWDDGKAQCEQVLASTDSVHMFVQKLVELAEYYHFDGWLINIENVVKVELLPNLLLLVDELTKAMHKASSNSQVIWYDSVITTGELKWQDELNDKNSCFFDVCDGIFLNYTWKDAGLERSALRAGSQSRLQDVYVGVDVFGRNCRGGGGFNTKEAIAAARKFDLSVAIFAQGWVYEKLGKDNFTANENKFWSLIKEFCHVEPLSSLPVVTTFCQGQGQKFSHQGQVLSDSPWTNLSLQSLQAMRTVHSSTPPSTAPSGGDHAVDDILSPDVLDDGDEGRLRLCCDDPYSGGSCIALMSTTKPQSYRLLKTDISVQEPFLIWYTYKLAAGTDWDAALRLEVESSGGMNQSLLLAATDFPMHQMHKAKVPKHEEATKTKSYSPLEADEIRNILKCYPDQGGLGDSHNGWITRFYKLDDVEGSVLKEIAMVTQVTVDGATTPPQILLGQLVVTKASELEETLLFTALEVEDATVAKVKEQSENAGESGVEYWCVSATLKWCFPAADYYMVSYTCTPLDEAFLLGSSTLYLGCTRLPRFAVDKLLLPVNYTKVTFTVQPVTRLGLSAASQTCHLSLLS